MSETESHLSPGPSLKGRGEIRSLSFTPQAPGASLIPLGGTMTTTHENTRPSPLEGAST